jgi:ring-1,2-phenylacetyl-CoA epoxidase subunit PaaB
VNSLDPRVKRLPNTGQPGQINPKAPLDQFGTFEVFVQPKEGKPFQHEGIVHAPDLEMAYVLSKETFTRRFTCVSLYVADTRNVHVSPLTEGVVNVYDILQNESGNSEAKTNFEIYHLQKRGKQHVHAGTVHASSAEEAMTIAKEKLRGDKVIYNVWAIRSTDIRFTTPEDQVFWLTLPEKKFRDAGDYKGGDKLKDFLDKKISTR